MINKHQRLCDKADLSCIEDSQWFFPENLNSENSPLKIRDGLFEASKTKREELKLNEADTFEILAHLCGLVLRISDPVNPFKHRAEFADGTRTVSLDDFDATHLKIFESALPKCSNTFIKARLNDVLWIKKRPSERAFAHDSISFYLELSKQSDIDHSTIVDARSYSNRAIQLWRLSGSDQAVGEVIRKVLSELMKLDQPEPDNYIRNHLFGNFVNCIDPSDSKRWIELGEALSKESLVKRNYEKARLYLEYAVSMCKISKDRSNAERLKSEQTKIFVLEARELRAAKAGPMILQDRYTKAIEAVRNAPGMADQARLLISELSELQLDIPSTLTEHSTTIDLTAPITQAIEEARTSTFSDALKKLAYKVAPSIKSELYHQAKNQIKESPLQALITGVILDEKGKVIAHKPSLGATEDNEVGVLRSIATQNYRFSVTIKGTLIRVLQQELNNRSDYSEVFFDHLMYPNPFIPNSRGRQIKHGLSNGLKGDWISALYILVPQLENSLRHLMQISGRDMIKVDNDGIQKEADLNSFIYNEEFITLVGEDLAFQLQVLLTDKTGLNLRNEIAHGLLTDGSALSEIGPYIWALTLLLCIHFQEQFIQRSS